MKLSDEITQMITDAESFMIPVAAGSHLYNDLGYDSLAFVCLLLKIEEAYSIKFELMEMNDCLQVDKLIALIEQKTEESAHD